MTKQIILGAITTSILISIGAAGSALADTPPSPPGCHKYVLCPQNYTAQPQPDPAQVKKIKKKKKKKMMMQNGQNMQIRTNGN